MLKTSKALFVPSAVQVISYCTTYYVMFLIGKQELTPVSMGMPHVRDGQAFWTLRSSRYFPSTPENDGPASPSMKQLAFRNILPGCSCA